MEPTTEAPEALVIVGKKCLDTLHQHYRDCPCVDEDEREVVRGNYAPVSYKKRKRAGKPDKFRDKFLNNSPNVLQWRETQLKLVDGEERYKRIARSFTRGIGIVGEISQENPQPSGDLIATGIKLAQLTGSSMVSMARQKAFAHFQLLVLLSYCLFLESNHTSWEAIDGILQTVTSFSEYKRKRLLIRARRVNTLICNLVLGGWSIYRATELFFLNALPPTYLLGILDDSFELIEEKLLEDDYVRYQFHDCLNVKFSIPMLLKDLLDQAYPADTFPYAIISAIKSQTNS